MKFLLFACLIAVATAVDVAQVGPNGEAGSSTMVTPGTSGNNPGPVMTYLQCTVSVEVSEGSLPQVGSAGWWSQQYPHMQHIAQFCSSSETTNIFDPKESTNKDGSEDKYTLPRGQMVNFQLSGGKSVPFLFLPFFGNEIQNLPGSKFSGVLTCSKTWSEAKIKLKHCTHVTQNHL